MQATETEAAGIGRALRKARLRRGKSLEVASRETRVKPEYLQALEAESFDVLLGDVYVRGFLRSYARYLGLNPQKVVSAYERVYGRPTPASIAPGMASMSALSTISMTAMLKVSVASAIGTTALSARPARSSGRLVRE